MDVDVNEDERLTNFTLGHKIKLMNSVKELALNYWKGWAMFRFVSFNKKGGKVMFGYQVDAVSFWYIPFLLCNQIKMLYR